LSGAASASVENAGQGDTPIVVSERTQVPLTLVHKDFCLHWRDIEYARQSGLPLDLAAAAAASAACAAREDDLILRGDKTVGIEGLSNAAGRRTMTRRDWGVGGHAFLDVVDAIDRLTTEGFYPPYALICSPNLYACLLRVYGNAGVLELTQVRELCTAGVFQSPYVTSALLIAVGPHNLDLVIGQDMTTAYVGSADLDYTFRVMETVGLRIKRAGAICALMPRTSSPTHRVRRGVPEEAMGVGD
jgi:uncharacterized linocin/CFP29 family protein